MEEPGQEEVELGGVSAPGKNKPEAPARPTGKEECLRQLQAALKAKQVFLEKKQEAPARPAAQERNPLFLAAGASWASGDLRVNQRLPNLWRRRKLVRASERSWKTYGS
jgi:hypothetical protein